MKNKIVFTGGGSGGHTYAALGLIKEIQSSELKQKTQVYYIGSYLGIEAKLIPKNCPDVLYYPIQTGKLRRYLSIQNFLDIIRIFIGCVQAFCFLLKIGRKDTLLFSTGGFVGLPAIFAAWILRIPIWIHEQTTCAGLANQVAGKFANKVFISFAESRKYFPLDKVQVSGPLLRLDIWKALDKDFKWPGETKTRPFRVLITGGGNGSELINQWVLKSLSKLKQLDQVSILHQVGDQYAKQWKEQYDEQNYFSLGHIQNMLDCLKAANLVIGRSGAGFCSEVLALKKSAVFIPLKIAQRNEQFFNAQAVLKDLAGTQIFKEDDIKQNDPSLEQIILKALQQSPISQNLNAEIKSGVHFILEQLVMA